MEQCRPCFSEPAFLTFKSEKLPAEIVGLDAYETHMFYDASRTKQQRSRWRVAAYDNV
jgi:hypothetical protein